MQTRAARGNVIKATAKSQYGLTLLLGLSKENVKRLQQGKPILVETHLVGGPPDAVVIFAGDTEESMTQQLAEEFGLPA